MIHVVLCLINNSKQDIHTCGETEDRLEGMNGTISVADLCREYNIRSARLYYWKDQLMNSAPEIFENHGRKVDVDRIRAEKDNEIARLKATIAEVVQENLDIKKRLESA